MPNIRNLITATALTIGAVCAQAGIVLDWSPQATGGTVTRDDWFNVSNLQYFAERVQFDSDTTINGIDVFGESGFGVVGDAAKVTIWSDAGAQPGDVVASHSTIISAADVSGTVGHSQQRLHADFTDFLMLAGVDYWIGMTGVGSEFRQTGLDGIAGGDGLMAQFNGTDSFSHFAPVGDMAFRLYGEKATPLPEPASFALAGVAFLAVAGSRRRLPKQA